MASGSGPESITIARPGSPVASTSPSPWPTSQSTIAQPVGGQPGASARTGINTTSAPTSAAATSTRNRRNRSSTSTTRITAASDTPPHSPVGHGNSAAGSVAARCATASSHQVVGQVSRATAPANQPDTGEQAIASAPSTMVGTNAGSATRLAPTAARLNCPKAAAISGAVARCADTAIANSSANPGGTPRRSNMAAAGRAKRIIAVVAKTDSANPMSPPNSGRHNSSAMIEPASAGTAALGRPVPIASSPAATISAARSTDGFGPATSRKTASTRPVTTARSLGPTDNRRSNQSTAPHTIMKWYPPTASR